VQRRALAGRGFDLERTVQRARIAYRDITNRLNNRTAIACLVPNATIHQELTERGLRNLVTWTRDVPLLVVCPARPEPAQPERFRIRRPLLLPAVPHPVL
jgi:hypothetical protein